MVTAHIKKLTKDFMVVQWSHPDKGFGELTIEYDEKGCYKVDAEYMSLLSVIQIIQAIPPLELIEP